MPIMPNSPAAAATPDPEAVAFATKILTDANTAGLTTNQFRTAVQIATNTLNNQKVQVPPPPAPAAG